MTIVFLSPKFYPHIGGVEKHAFEVAKRLNKKGHKIIVVTEGEKDRRENLNGIVVYRFNFGEKGWLKKFRIWFKLFTKRKLFNKAKIIHCHDVFIWYLPFRFIYLRKRVYTTFHGYETEFPLSSKAIFIRKLSEKLSFGNICVGDYIKRWYSTNPTYVTYGAHDDFRKTPRSRSCNPKKPRLLFLGRIEEDNGVSIYSEVLKKFRKKIIFEACGDGALKREFQKYGDVHGFVKNIDPYLDKADIVFTSSYLSIINSLYFKKYVFAVYNNPLKKDYLKTAPFAKFLYINNSSERVYAELSRLFKIKKVKQNPGFDWARKQTWEEVTNVYKKLFEI